MILKDHMGMPASYKQPSKVKEKLEPSHKELKNRGFLAEVVYDGNRVYYRVAEEFVQARSSLDRSWGSEESAIYRALLRNEVWPNVARTLIHEQGAEACRFYVEALPYQKNVRSPGAWLKKFIGERLPLPIEPPQRRLYEADVAPVESAPSERATRTVKKIWLRTSPTERRSGSGRKSSTARPIGSTSPVCGFGSRA
jgi:hypothetical protein